MRLRPVENTPEPDYPDYKGFHQDRREFLRRMGMIAGALLAGAAAPGCGKEEPQHLGGEIAVPAPPPPQPPPPQPPPVRLGGAVAPPDPALLPPDEPNIAGGLRAPHEPGEGDLKEPPEAPKEEPK
ncbi:MAG: hypothetical protein IT452_14805 [Planctomycetia bacterium]|nr:hypothetical protein [Planctomycetia bacterium]